MDVCLESLKSPSQVLREIELNGTKPDDGLVGCIFVHRCVLFGQSVLVVWTIYVTNPLFYFKLPQIMEVQLVGCKRFPQNGQV
jgi:hypothetical protein